MQRLLRTVFTAALFGMAGCHTCDVCDDCGDGGGNGNGKNGCKKGCGSHSYHAKVYGDPGWAPGYVPPTEYSKSTQNPTQGTPVVTTNRVQNGPQNGVPTTAASQTYRTTIQQ
jgi:hypothetical protein